MRTGDVLLLEEPAEAVTPGIWVIVTMNHDVTLSRIAEVENDRYRPTGRKYKISRATLARFLPIHLNIFEDVEFGRESYSTQEYKPMTILHFAEAFDYDSQRKAFLFEAREADRPFTCVLPIAEVGARFHTQSVAETEQAFRSNFSVVQTATQAAFQRHGADINGELLVTLM